jgi:hypothetical protein
MNTTMKPVRRAVVKRNAIGTPTAMTVGSYLPGNYSVTSVSDTKITIEGTDKAGWTLDGYVIPRLASGLITAEEVT